MTFKKFCMILSAFIAVFLISTVETYAADADVIENNEAGIPNKVLYEKILNELGKKPGETFTEGEAKTIDSLSLTFSSNSNLKGIGRLSALEELWLYFPKPVKVSQCLKGIEELTGLRELEIEGNQLIQMKNLASLQGLTGLESLQITQGNITSLHGVEGLVSLKRLWIEWDQLTSLHGVQHLKNLQSLSVAGNRLTSLKGVEGLKNLEHLSAEYNEITSLKEVRGLRKLSLIYMTDNCLENVDAIKNLKNLEYLKLDENRLSKLPNMKKLTKLSENETLLEQNFLSEKELVKKLPAHLLKKWNQAKWLAKSQLKKYTLRITAPKNKKITASTKRIEGRTSKKGATVKLMRAIWHPCDGYLEYIPIQSVKADKNGRFVMKNLKLKKYKKDKLKIRIVN